MALLKKSDKVKPLKTVSRGGGGGSVSALRPAQTEKLAPCLDRCPAGNDVRLWINTISQQGKSGVALDHACDKAFGVLAGNQPLPAVMGRVCARACENKCNRVEKDGAVGI